MKRKFDWLKKCTKVAYKNFLQIKVSFLHIRGRLETHNFHSLFMTNSCAIIDRYYHTVQNIAQWTKIGTFFSNILWKVTFSHSFYLTLQLKISTTSFLNSRKMPLAPRNFLQNALCKKQEIDMYWRPTRVKLALGTWTSFKGHYSMHTGRR